MERGWQRGTRDKATGRKQFCLVAHSLLLAYSLRQLFAGGKAHALGSWDLDFLGTIARVDSLAGGAGAYLEGPEAHQAYLVPLLQRLANGIQCGLQRCCRLLLGKVRLLGHAFYQLLTTHDG